MSNLRVAANSATAIVHTIDEHGLCARTLSDVIAHAANRHAAQHGGRFYLNGYVTPQQRF